jgi:hypothetical protein
VRAGPLYRGFVNILRRSVDAAMTLDKVRPLRIKKIFSRKGFLLCGATYPRLSEPLLPRHPWGLVPSAAKVTQLCASSSAKRELCKSWEKGKAYS